jgi:hypothetical protein
VHVPGWHEATQSLRENGDIRMVGIIQEQHPDRARLFMQWKRMGWPILVDSYNLLEVPYVPITLAVDEHGIIRQVLGRAGEGVQLGDAFVEEHFGGSRAEAGATSPHPTTPDLDALEDAATTRGGPPDLRAFGDALAVWGGEDRLDDAIEAYERAATLEPDHGFTHFRLGVAYRTRHDSDARRNGDFQRAIDHWTAALSLDPNQYIWRRRIQQYGPRLDKPYPFYDWVVQARQDIVARGEDPAPLIVEPRGSEFAAPVREFTAASEDEVEPDPRDRVVRDHGEFVGVETVAVPSAVAPGDVVRVHFTFRPNVTTEAHWNNEAEDMLLWVDPPRGWTAESRLVSHPIPPELVSREERTVELELQAPERIRGTSVMVPAYALYYVCEDVNGICMYRRQDLEVNLSVQR